jgi:hypothetical protein
VVALPCEASWELEYSGCGCAWPLCGSGGLRGKKSTPSIGWEVPVRSQRLASGSEDKRKFQLENTNNNLPRIDILIGYGI